MTDAQERKDRDEAGRFVKGNKVPSPHRGRPARGDTMPVLIAVAQGAYTPEQLVDMLHETYEMSKEKGDWKGMFQVIQFVVNYAVGKPVQRSISASVDPDEIRKMLQEGMGHGEGRDEGDEGVIYIDSNDGGHGGSVDTGEVEEGI